ncbi:uncharacterized protein LOC141665343 [Apium graveolens]|uniref:uncharacterized protein LOC141665343 n=1 Tax=Apium graveolens TaxID=4045 RepID=UPI003D796901
MTKRERTAIERDEQSGSREMNNQREIMDETYLGNGKEGGDNDLWTEGQGDRDDLWAGENDEGMYESESDESEYSIGDGSESDFSDCRRIREEVRKEQKALDEELDEEIKKSLLKYKNKAEEFDSDSDYYGSYNSEDETDEDIAYAEPPKFKKQTKVNEVFNMNTAGKDIKWVPGLIFGDKSQIKATVRNFSIESGRPLRYLVDDKQRIQVACAKGCPFKMWISYIQIRDCWQIKTVNDVHNCIYHYSNKLVTVKYLVDVYGNKIRRNPSWKLKEMQEEFKKVLKVEVCEAKCCRVRQMALSGVQEEMKKHYAGLRKFAGEILRSNKNNTVKITTTRVNEEDAPHFQRFYVCYDQLKKAWKEGCRPIIGLDGCFLKTVCGGQLLSAVGRDGNNSMFPIAMAVVETESYASWSWFLHLLIEGLFQFFFLFIPIINIFLIILSKTDAHT